MPRDSAVTRTRTRNSASRTMRLGATTTRSMRTRRRSTVILARRRTIEISATCTRASAAAVRPGRHTSRPSGSATVLLVNARRNCQRSGARLRPVPAARPQIGQELAILHARDNRRIAAAQARLDSSRIARRILDRRSIVGTTHRRRPPGATRLLEKRNDGAPACAALATASARFAP